MKNIQSFTTKGLSAVLLGFTVLASSCDKNESEARPAAEIGHQTMATTSAGSSFIFNSSFEGATSVSDEYLEGATANSITRSAEQAKTGSYSAKFVLNKTDAIVGGSKRSEMLLDWVEQPKFERWYGMSIFVPSSYVNDPAEEQLFQWHAMGTKDLDGVSMVNSPMAMYTKNGRWEFFMKYGGTFDLGPYEKGKWTDWVVHVKFSHESDGIFELWKDGKLVVKTTGRNNYRDLKGNYFKIGVYKYAWTDGYASTTTTRTLYYDDVKIGDGTSSYADVAPGGQATSPAPAPVPAPEPTPAPAPSTTPVFAVNGGGAEFKASNGITYQADRYFSGGFSHSVTGAVANTTDDLMFQKGHYGTNFSYNVPVANGTYDVVFGFVENYNSSAGLRQFDVLGEGKEIISNLDIFTVAGKSKAYFLTRTISVTDGKLNLNFRSDRGDAMVAAFHVVKSSSTVSPEPAPAPAPSPSVTFSVNGGGSEFKASNGITYQADKYFSGGFSHKVTTAVANTTDDAMFQVGHYGDTFSYNVPVANGTYDVVFSFVENYNSSAGLRQFDVLAESKEIIANLDIYKVAGKSKAYFLTRTVSVTDGTLNLNFRGDKGHAMVAAFHLIKK
ncbi:MAG TPA: malectin domain-containing carbohydrate-binding protein [Sphingobacteriaceae bacterium]